MKNLLIVTAIAVSLSLATGCAIPQTTPVQGGFLTYDVKGPVGGVDNDVKPTKRGMSEATGIICVSFGDASITKAMEEGDITQVHHVDNEVMSVLQLFTVNKTIVYGE